MVGKHRKAKHWFVYMLDTSNNKLIILPKDQRLDPPSDTEF